jgi:hypothetical protein
MNPLRYVLQQEPLPPGSMRQEQGEEHDLAEELHDQPVVGGKALPVAQEDEPDARLLNHEK